MTYCTIYSIIYCVIGAQQTYYIYTFLSFKAINFHLNAMFCAINLTLGNSRIMFNFPTTTMLYGIPL